jgi:hypothetical protein
VSVRGAFARQAAFCTDLGSPFTARLCTLAAERLRPGGAVADRLLGWPGDPSSRGDALPLRLAGALHGLVLERRDPGLAAVYPPNHAGVSDDGLWQAVQAAFAAHAGYVLERLAGPPQTNEVQRSAALAPGFLTVAALTGLPLALTELGASAGLNLIWDRFAYRFGPTAWGDPASPVAIAPDWRGSGPPATSVRVLEQPGCDRAPVDVADPAARLRLLSYVWADQAERVARLHAAMALADSAGVTVARADAGDFLTERLAMPRPGAVHVVYHSIIWPYLGPAGQARCRDAIEAAGARATHAAPIAWLRLEGDGLTAPGRHPREGDGAARGAGLALTLWPGGHELTIAHADFHGRWVEWAGWEG